jgi:hypothetical protein
MPALSDLREQAVTGVAPPQLNEAIIRDIWPSVSANSAAASFARACYRSTIFAPIGWLALAPLKFQKLLAILPGLSGMATRYRLTNRRLAICKGLRPQVDRDVSLDRIRDVRIVRDSNSDFFLAGTLEIVGDQGTKLMELPGVPEPESVRYAILQAAAAWGPLLSNGVTPA